MVRPAFLYLLLISWRSFAHVPTETPTMDKAPTVKENGSILTGRRQPHDSGNRKAMTTRKLDQQNQDPGLKRQNKARRKTYY